MTVINVGKTVIKRIICITTCINMKECDCDKCKLSFSLKSNLSMHKQNIY